MLTLTNVSRSFGGLQALFNVNMTVPQGRVVGLIGPNGAGKTTLINNISGLDHPTSGTIAFDGTEIQTFAPHRITRLGIARTYQNIRLFGDMTALENLLIGQHGRGSATVLQALAFTPGYRREEARLWLVCGVGREWLELLGGEVFLRQVLAKNPDPQRTLFEFDFGG